MTTKSSNKASKHITLDRKTAREHLIVYVKREKSRLSHLLCYQNNMDYSKC